MYITVYNKNMRTTEARYKVGKPYEKLIDDLKMSLSNTLVTYNDTDVVRRALEELWKRANPGKELPMEVRLIRKVYYSDDGLDAV